MLDPATVTLIKGLGGLKTIAISHPHFYTTMVEWSRAFGGIPIYLHADDQQWIMRPDPSIKLWTGETLTLAPEVTLIRCGGHFRGDHRAFRMAEDQVSPRPDVAAEAAFADAAHKVSLDLDSNLPFIYVDPVLVEQAFTQVIDNAAKYSPNGSTIKVAARRNGHDLILSVNDTGAGLTDAEKARIGERFFRGPRHTNTTSGSGLGLWIAKAFVVANGGKIEADSTGADQGTTVSIHLPLAPDAPQLEAAPDD
jgi:anti-sigma regulatory factor (Ser/Thr protein kinase)